MSYNICFLDRATLRHDIAIRRPGFEHKWTEYDHTSDEQTADRIAGMDIIITNKVPINRILIENNPDLKMIAVAATGVDVIDLDACSARNVTVSNIRNYALHTVPEHVMGMILTLRRQVLQYRQQVINGRWQEAGGFCFFDEPIHDIHGALLGIIGFGALGQATARLAHLLGMQVQYVSPSDKSVDFARRVSLDECLATSDVISLHCPLTPETHHLLDNQAFSRMKNNVIIINAARGAIVDEPALADAIISGKIAGAAIDVLPQEPPAKDSPLMMLASQTNVILTPHIAWASQQAMQSLADQLIDNIEAFQEGQPRNQVI
jgi:glycerate dehydrogenase